MCLFINMEGKFTLRIYFLVPLFLYPNFFHIFKRKHINFSIIGDCACTSHSSKCMWFKVLVCYMLLVRKECAIGSPFYTSRWLFFFFLWFYLFIYFVISVIIFSDESTWNNVDKRKCVHVYMYIPVFISYCKILSKERKKTEFWYIIKLQL